MGQEIKCSASLNGQVSEGKAYLETNHILFRGDFRIQVPFDTLTNIQSYGGQLLLSGEHGVLVITFKDPHAGGLAAQWAEKIRNPKSVLDKLGVKPGDIVSLIGVGDADLLEKLSALAPGLSISTIQSSSDIIFYAADSLAELDRLPELKAHLKPNGAIWIISKKGKAATIKDTEIMAAAKEVRLVDTKVVGFSPTHTALKFVIPVSER